MAKKKTTKNESLSTEQKWGLGVGLTAAAVAAVGTYFLYGSKDAEKNRKKVRSWMLKAKADVLEQLERAKNMTQEEYEEIVNAVAATYEGLQDASQKDIREFKKEMKAQWETIASHAASGAKSAKKSATKATSSTAKSAKKTATKTATKGKKTATKPATKATKKATKATKASK